ncbi:MAG: TonB-dependent receptor [Zetaproteobacteria bacterium]|nr:TonB-dependent receptor [Zetaproteobacteria bacterium]
MNKTYILGSVVSAMLLAIPLSIQNSYAQNLGDISVQSGHSVSSVKSAVAQSSTVIDRVAIETSGAQNVVDLFKSVANVTVRDTSGIVAKSQVDLGGFGESAAANSVVLVDGRRVNAPDLSGVDWTQIPLDQIERIEIIHGGAAVAYGQGAVGGAINIVTKIPEQGFGVEASVGSYGGVAEKIYTGAGTDKVRLALHASGNKTDGYRQNGQFERYDSGLRGEVDLPAESLLYFSGNHHTDRSGMPGSLTLMQMSANPRQTNTPNDYATATDDFFNVGVQSSLAAIDVDLPVSVRTRSAQAVYGGFAVPSNMRIYETRPKMELNTHIGSIVTHVVVGADLQRTEGDFGGIVAKRVATDMYHLLRFSDETQRLSVVGGFRSVTNQDQLTQTPHASIKNKKLIYNLGINGAHMGYRVALGHSTSVRNPLLDERYNWMTSNWNNTLLNQAGKHFNALMGYENDLFSTQLSWQRADLTDEIYYDPTAFANQNYQSATRHDAMMWQNRINITESLRIAANYTYTQAKFLGGLYSGNEIPGVARQKANLHIDWEVMQGLALGGNVAWTGSSRSISDQANVLAKLPAYTLVDLSAQYHWQGAKLFVNLDNVTNKKYSSYSAYGVNYYPAATFTARAGVGYSF